MPASPDSLKSLLSANRAIAIAKGFAAASAGSSAKRAVAFLTPAGTG